ncbi:lipoprotein [Actinoplanes palleronii]|uniref:lipoprotein n=1 Tax=Actinoplanes palleronii TaxID=113570 RepID=UPI001944071A|nr:lipoprotein [Actinoplanes palleronii]
MIKSPQRTLRVFALGATLLFAGACETSEDDAGAAGTPRGAAASAADNTAEICKSGGEAARTVVVNLFKQLADVMKSGSDAADVDLNKIYATTFGSLRDTLTAESGKATDPKLAAVLTEIATEANKIATAGEPETVGTDGLEASLTKLETFCPSTTPSASAAAGATGTPGATGVVGAKGSPCVLPVSFTIPAKWTMKSIDLEDDSPLAELGRKGSLKMACEVDSRPAGPIGFLRVWAGPKSVQDPRAALKAFQTGETTRKVTYAPVEFDGQPGVELKYQTYSKLLEEWSDRQAFAVPTPKGAVVVELGGLERDDPAVLAGYAQAKSSVKVNA